MNYGQTFKTLRESNGITQEELAKEINVLGRVYSQYETEYTVIPSKHLNTLCNYFDISIDYAFSFTRIKQYKNSINEIDKIKAGIRLKEWRKKKNLTQSKLASVLNTTQSVIADYERGRYLIATPFLYTICKKYDVSADYLLGKIDI